VDPENSLALSNLGAVMLLRGKVPGALERLSKAIETDPRNPDAQSNLGIAYYEAGDMPRAIAHLEEALKLAPGHKMAQDYLKRTQATSRTPRP